MPDLVANGALLKCSMGMTPCALIIPPSKATSTMLPVATMKDHTLANIPTFGMCKSMANPTVAAATAAAMGSLTPMPCLPNLPAPWSGTSTKTTIGGQPALIKDSKLTCAFGGQIEITMPGQMKAKTS